MAPFKIGHARSRLRRERRGSPPAGPLSQRRNAGGHHISAPPTDTQATCSRPGPPTSTSPPWASGRSGPAAARASPRVSGAGSGCCRGVCSRPGTGERRQLQARTQRLRLRGGPPCLTPTAPRPHAAHATSPHRRPRGGLMPRPGPDARTPLRPVLFTPCSQGRTCPASLL